VWHTVVRQISIVDEWDCALSGGGGRGRGNAGKTRLRLADGSEGGDGKRRLRRSGVEGEEMGLFCTRCVYV